MSFAAVVAPSRPHWLVAAIGMLALAVFSAVVGVGRETVWAHHALDGAVLWTGGVPAPPAYPMWGYSWWAGLFGVAAPFAQAALAIPVMAVCLASVAAMWTASTAGRLRRLGVGALALVALGCWGLLAVSYYSNSVYSIGVAAGLLLVAREMGSPTARRGRLVAAGVAFGVAYHMRSEAAVVATMLALLWVLRGVLRGAPGRAIRSAAIVLATLAVCASPWLVWTATHLDAPRLSSTNGPAVAYIGLGFYGGNPWGIVADDSHADKALPDDVPGGPWGEAASRYFRAAFIDAVRTHPGAFLRRMAVGLKLCAMQGLFTARGHKVFFLDKAQTVEVDRLREALKGMLGLPVNKLEMQRYGDADPLASISAAAKGAFVTELLGRALGAVVWLLVAGLFAVALLVGRLRDDLTLVALAALVPMLAIAATVQSLPRHTTGGALLAVLVAVGVGLRSNRTTP